LSCKISKAFGDIKHDSVSDWHITAWWQHAVSVRNIVVLWFCDFVF